MIENLGGGGNVSRKIKRGLFNREVQISVKADEEQSVIQHFKVPCKKARTA